MSILGRFSFRTKPSIFGNVPRFPHRSRLCDAYTIHTYILFVAFRIARFLLLSFLFHVCGLANPKLKGQKKTSKIILQCNLYHYEYYFILFFFLLFCHMVIENMYSREVDRNCGQKVGCAENGSTPSRGLGPGTTISRLFNSIFKCVF